MSVVSWHEFRWGVHMGQMVPDLLKAFDGHFDDEKH